LIVRLAERGLIDTVEADTPPHAPTAPRSGRKLRRCCSDS
jgi:hypothetical protein